jgi:hypothetical protein
VAGSHGLPRPQRSYATDCGRDLKERSTTADPSVPVEHNINIYVYDDG